jgi:hypothetical protein
VCESPDLADPSGAFFSALSLEKNAPFESASSEFLGADLVFLVA